MSTEITLTNYTTFTQKQLQDFNVSRGMARCANESKEKTLKKTRTILETCMIQLDKDDPFFFPYPEGKNKHMLLEHIREFFTNNNDTWSPSQ